MEVLKDKTIVILFNNNSKEIEEIAIDVYKELKEKGLNAMFATTFNQLSLIRHYGNHLLYLFLYDGQVVPINKHRRSIYHLHDVTHPEHYWLDQYDGYDLDKAINFFIDSPKELAAIK